MIVQADSTFVLNHQVKHVFRKAGIKHFRKLNLIHAVSVTIDANQLYALSKIKGLTVTPDVPVKVSGYTSSAALAVRGRACARLDGIRLADGRPARRRSRSSTRASRPTGPTSPTAACSRSVNLSTLANTLPGAADGRGHGTFVAGIAAGAAAGLRRRLAAGGESSRSR